MLKPIHIDRVQSALDVLTDYYTVDQVTDVYISEPRTLVTLTDGSFFTVGQWDNSTPDFREAIKQVYGGDPDEVLSLHVNMEDAWSYEVISTTDIPVPGATNVDQVYTERRIGRVLR